MKNPPSLKITASGCLMIGVMLLSAIGSPSERSTRAKINANPQSRSVNRTIEQWLDYPFDPSAPIGNAKNPAVLLPTELAALVAKLTNAKRIGETVLVSAAELKKAADLPFARTMLAPVLSKLS